MERMMKFRWLILAGTMLGLALAAANPALARYKAKLRCTEQPYPFTWSGIWFNPRPQPNGCAPPVFEGGVYVGQDPDPYIRQQLRRDPETGYAYEFAH
jgi:hypothetical protein